MFKAPLKHIIFVPGPSWGHLRPALRFAARMVDRFPDLFISLFMYAPQVGKASEYLTTQSIHSRQRIRFVPSISITNPLSDSPAPAMIRDPLVLLSCLETQFRTWVSEELSKINSEINGFWVAPPTWIVEDHITGGISLASKDTHGLPVVSWWLGPATSLISRIGNEEHGHGGRLLESIAAAYDGGELEDEKMIEELYNQNLTNRLVCTPGIPAHYEHEQTPQFIPSLLSYFSRLVLRWNNMMQHVDHIVFCTTYEMEPISAESCHQAFSKPITPFFVGPAVDPPSHSSSRADSEVSQFLDRAYTECGSHSVIYIAFGTAFFPMRESIGHFMIVIDEIVVQGFRLVFARSSAAAQASGLSEGYIKGLVKGGKAIIPAWVDQIEVLEHPAVHYFLTHGGWNSTIEAVVRGVPMIFWPFGTDQPVNALLIAAHHDCGFELIQIRTGPAKSVAYRPRLDTIIIGTDDAIRDEIRTILEMSKGARGKQQRLQVQLLGEVVLRSLEGGGSGDADLGRVGLRLGLRSV
ncbi:UDP-Glycosyltransferase/glycogen phosphorylase [Ceratobasidium sp. AG-I]|nr:UDP-Glycosyltransferase/glycogen phosphorylase [Ceratobasidium sp. AG-I]